MKKVSLDFLLISLTVFACSVEPDKNIDYEKVNEEIKAKKIKRLTDNDVMQLAFDFGASVSEKLKPAAENRESACAMFEMPALEKLQRRAIDTVIIACKEELGFSPKEKTVWRSYAAAAANGQAATNDNLQKLEDGRVLYTVPLGTTNSNEKVSPILLNIYIDTKELIKAL